MAKVTVAQLSERVDQLEKLPDECKRRIDEQFAAQRTWLTNGFSSHISKVVVKETERMFLEHDNEHLKAMLDAQQEANREYGQAKDKEREEMQAKAERKLKWRIALLGFGGPIIVAAISVVSTILITGGGG